MIINFHESDDEEIGISTMKFEDTYSRKAWVFVYSTFSRGKYTHTHEQQHQLSGEYT